MAIKPENLRVLKIRVGRELKFSPLPPTVKARLDIKNLACDPALIPIIILGNGTLSDEQLAENRRRATLRDEKRLAIIQKYGVTTEYIKKSEQNIAQLQEKIAKMRTQIVMERNWIKRLRS